MRKTTPEAGMKTPRHLSNLSISSLIAVLLSLATSQAGNTQQLVLEIKDTRGSQPAYASNVPTSGNKQSVPKASAQLLQQGNQVSLNGRVFPVAWSQWKQGKSISTGISDIGLMQTMGVDLLNTNNSTQQPAQWFNQRSLLMSAQLRGAYRYLDITNFARSAGWRVQADGNVLQISSPPARVKNLQQQPQQEGISDVPKPYRLVVDLDRPTPWQVSQERNEAIITIEGLADPTLIKRFPPPPPPQPLTPNPQLPISSPSPTLDSQPLTPNPQLPISSPSPTPNLQPPSPIVESSQNQTKIRLNIPVGWRPRVSTVPNPNRLFIDIAPDAVAERDILWAPGLRWRQQFVNVGSSRFPVVWLEVNQRQPGLSIKPIWSNPATLVGIAPLVKTAPLWQASAAVNAGYFNRKELLPLGAIRRDGRWLSGPILNRGAIAWNDAGNIKIGQLSLQETAIASTGERLPILFLNSGYVQAGISRYTPEWGPTYTPLTDKEILVVVQKNQIINAITTGPAVNKTSYPIPSDGYLLTIRAKPELANLFAIGTALRIENMTTPTDFNGYPHILGAGPVLVQNRQIVLDAKAEKFSDAFIKEAAIRSVIATTASGNLMIAAVHNRAGGSGPTLAETAQIVQQMGAVNALNLDGGSSTSLYLGGQLINRSPSTAARVHNGLGIFLQPRF
ncbi:MAG: phosphodiester glycosidase family protein [Aphanothece sp. CMT-3BRIN-NPC111]|jgi:hypothetical protein|nr:phosphodiester glycosidase family protein [Aphanothece sp. CMT-3BRIN-NPC111]